MKSAFGMCFNWKVLAGLAVVGAGILVIAPGLIIGALPLLLLAACPLSMLLMMRGMNGHTMGNAHAEEESGKPLPKEFLEQRLAALQEEEHKLQAEVRKLELSSEPISTPASETAGRPTVAR